ncbi:hypothetical protein PPL_10820 [Heterostelium album PN500]|uniref:F-box domain-containing protein n=1 Tax=Heterostelium pallidum (strain ATCC 26659 / Pp 5 / PN500) TaxID=670386 RepID=D3BS28_HETP5|nr:hypothetical protein PPL_10820 [Heterostelium album PN500]EFA75765.1 hypothetical protein PPL_10820 [Heterostelium album PN500]|eukprot:XP_020427899.1 hypothetical protein PPL_10820 [Heterostelium album PN500]
MREISHLHHPKMSDNNNNSTHKLVNLPHILLSNIVDNLTDNIDKICFSLVCKRWFENRNRYLLFDTNTLYCIDKHNSRIKLNSYRSIISESLSKKKQRNMYVTQDKNDIGHYDYIIDYDSIVTIDEIDQSIVTVIQSMEMLLRIEQEKLFTKLYQLISKSNVTCIEDCQTLKYGIPMNITSLTFSFDFNEPLFKGCFPPNLKKLKLDGTFNQVIEVGVLPDTLEKFETSTINQILEPGVLPTSLKIFKMLTPAPDNYLKVGSLPPNLQKFVHYGGEDDNIDLNVLPNSLIKLDSVPLSWMKSIKQLENLRSLMLKESSGLLDLADLPKSLTRLYISYSVTLKSALPTSIRHLTLSNSKYDIDELFPDRSLYHLESLQLSAFKQESLDGLDIKCLRLVDYRRADISQLIRAVPFGVERLEIVLGDGFDLIKQNSLPSSLKTLDIDNLDSLTRPGIIPNSVNHLIIRDHRSGIVIPEGVLPDSVQNIKVTKALFPTSKMVDNITFKNYNGKKCSIRKLDDQYYIVFGHQNYEFIASLFHKSMFLDKVKVLKIITDNIDKICFSLVCKRWFDNRNRYLLFDTNTLYCIDKHSSKITLNSYRSIISESLNKKKQCTMLLISQHGYINLFNRFDHFIDINSIESIDQNIETVSFKRLSLRDVPDKLFTRLYDLISKSNILEPGVLPTSLKVFRISGSAPDNYLKVGSLPPNLQEFIHNGKDFNIDSNVLPNSLITLERVPVSWMKSIKQLEKLESLWLTEGIGLLDLSDLPQSLTRLDISCSVNLQSSLPTSIRHLNIAKSEYDIDELFPDRSLYHLDYLQVSPFKQESLDGLDIKILRINEHPIIPGTLRAIPFGVETLEIAAWYEFKFNKNLLPSSLKTLDVCNMRSFTHAGIIPNSVNHLIIQNGYDSDTEEGIIPDSIQNIKMGRVAFPTKMVDNISFEDFSNNKCSIRKLDDQYYIVFGHVNNEFIASLFHKSMFSDKAIKILSGK